MMTVPGGGIVSARDLVRDTVGAVALLDDHGWMRSFAGNSTGGVSFSLPPFAWAMRRCQESASTPIASLVRLGVH